MSAPPLFISRSHSLRRARRRVDAQHAGRARRHAVDAAVGAEHAALPLVTARVLVADEPRRDGRHDMCAFLLPTGLVCRMWVHRDLDRSLQRIILQPRVTDVTYVTAASKRAPTTASASIAPSLGDPDPCVLARWGPRGEPNWSARAERDAFLACCFLPRPSLPPPTRHSPHTRKETCEGRVNERSSLIHFLLSSAAASALTQSL